MTNNPQPPNPGGLIHTYLGYDPGGVDGVLGNGCRVALIGFQKACGVSPAGGELDDPTRSRLEQACGV